MRSRLFALSILCLPLVACGAADRFAATTGFTLPETAKLMLEGDTNDGEIRGGETYMAYQVGNETIQQWLDAGGPWGQTWRQGPVEADVGGRTSFGSVDAGYDANASGSYVFSHDSVTIRELLSSKGTLYVARERCCDDVRWKSGDFLILDLAKSQAWLSSWDF